MSTRRRPWPPPPTGHHPDCPYPSRKRERCPICRSIMIERTYDQLELIGRHAVR